MSKTLNNLEFRQLAFKEISQRYKEPKTQRRAFSFLEAAIQCFDRKGFENVTTTMIAREAGVTRQLLNHYFKDLHEIRESSIKYIRVIGQKLLLSQLEKETNPHKLLEIYLRSHLLWSNHFNTHVRVWLKFLSYCSKNESDRLLNSEAILIGHRRIEEILRQGRISGVFHHKDDTNTATFIQTIIAGWLVSLLSEKHEKFDDYSEIIIQNCMNLVH